MTVDPKPMDADELAALRSTARKMRRLILEAAHRAGAGHTGGALSIVEILAVLYRRILRIDPARPRWEARDRFILSKGHAAIALYAALALRGYFPEERMCEFDHVDGMLQGHPDMLKTPGVDMSTGALGQGLSAGIGMALGARRSGIDCRVFVLLGDGEMQEGQVWEAVMYAGFHKVDRLIGIIDANGLQLTGRTRDILNLEPLPDKLRAFGWETFECDGHDLAALKETLRRAAAVENQPAMLIARTEKGHGISFMADRVEWHAKAPDADEFQAALRELECAD
ncbi:MAG: transketolase [Planctomycetota bacterium]